MSKFDKRYNNNDKTQSIHSYGRTLVWEGAVPRPMSVRLTIR